MSHSLSRSVFAKAHDISFAVFRVAHVVKNMRLRMALEDAAVDLVANPSDGTVDKLLALVKLTVSINEIKTLNAEVLERELNLLSDMFQQAINAAISENRVGNDEEPDLAESFAELPAVSKPSLPTLAKHDKSNNNGNIAIRQSAILDFIRKLPNGCRMRDLLTKFPEVSERTLRNDLQDLNAEGLVERLGKGAFSSFRAVTKHEIIAL